MGTIAFLCLAAASMIVISILYYPLQKWVQKRHDDEFAKMMGWDKEKKKSRTR